MSNVMTPMNSYLIEALLKWIADNGCTPYAMINAEYPKTIIPKDFVKEGKIVLNIDHHLVKDFFLDQEAISFAASFGGRSMDVYLPIGSIVSVFAKETQQGLGLPHIEPDVTEEVKEKENSNVRPLFKVVK